MPIPECLKSGSAQEREWLNAWMEMMETKMRLLEAGFTLEKKAGGLTYPASPAIHLQTNSNGYVQVTQFSTDVPKGYTPTPAQTARIGALATLMGKIERDELEKLANQKDQRDVENEEYLLDLTEEHIRDPSKKMAYGPLVTAALKQRIDAYHKEIRAVLSKKFRPAPSAVASAASGGGGGSDPHM